MGKNEISKTISNMPNEEYVTMMGGYSSQRDKDSGTSQPAKEAYRYFDLLRNYALNRYTWQSNILEPHELQLIEWLFFKTNRACLVFPTFYKHKNSNKGIKIKIPSVFDTTITKRNDRTSIPLIVNITDAYTNTLLMPMKRIYDYTEFAMLSSNYLMFEEQNITLADTAWEYANKLHELDLTFNANATKQRIPLLFNNGENKTESKNNPAEQLYMQGNLTAGTVVREAMNRNEQFVEIPQTKIGENGLLHSTNQYQENNLQAYIETQRKLYDEYFELIGVEVVQEQHGVYQTQDVQTKTLANNNYKALIGLRNRRHHAESANKKFGLDLRVQQLEYM